MYKLYDIQIDRQILSSLAYILFESNINIKNKFQFDTIMYKFYNYVKDDINFDNGIVLTNELKNKIIEFSKIINNLPNSSIESEYLFSFDVAGKTTDGDFNLEEEYYSVSTAGSIHMADAKITNSGSTFYPTIYLEASRKSDGYITSVTVSTKSFTESFAYFKVGFKNYSSSYVYVIVELYDENDTLITSYEKTSGSRTLKPDTYNFKIKYVYDNSTVSNIYSHYNYFIYDYVVDSDTFDNINVEDLVINAKYFAEDIMPNNLRKYNYNIHNITGKTLNGETKDHPYQKMLILLNKDVCPGDNNTYKYLTVLKEQEGETLSAFISTKQFYYTGRTNATDQDVCLANISDADSSLSMYFRWFNSSDNGDTWTLQKSTIGGSVNSFVTSGSYHKMDYRYPIYIKGYDVIFNNYPIMYGVKAIKTVLDEEITKFDATKRLNVWKNSNEEYTLFDLPAGASFYFGKYRVEDSPINPLTFAVCSYSDSLDRVCALSTHKLEYMCYNTIIPNSSTKDKGYAPKAELYQWLNSRKIGNTWWTSYYDTDLEPNEENCLADSYGFYSHKDGFLSNFTSSEIDLIEERQLNFGQYVGSNNPENIAKVHLPSASEFGNDSASLLTGKAGYTYLKSAGLHHNLKYHLKQFDESSFLDGDNIGGANNSNDLVFLRYDNQWKIGLGSGASTRTSFVDRNTAHFVQPFMLLKNAKVLREPDENGVFILDLPKDETIPFNESFKTERSINNNFNFSAETNLTILNNFENIFETFKAIGVSFEESFIAFRNIRNNANEKYSAAKHNVANFVKLFETSRMHNYIHTLSFPTKISILANFEKVYSTERNTNEEYEISIKYETERRRLKNFVERFKTSITTLGLFEKSYKIHRFVRAKKEVVYETQIDTIEHREFNYPLQRFILQNKTTNVPTRIKVTNNFESIFGTRKDTHIRNDYFFPVERKIREPLEAINDNLVRFVEGKSESIYPTFRYMSEPTILRYNCVRKVTERHAFKYPTSRKIIRHLQALEIYSTNRYIMANSKYNYSMIRKTIANVFDEANLLRYVVQNADFVANCERYILENITSDYELCRSIIEDFEKINEAVIYTLNNIEEEYNSELRLTQIFNLDISTLREVIDMIEVNYPTKRATTVTTNKYVSKDNLMLYTVLLKQEISSFIEQKINYELDKRGL